jgi:hypothetical protein
MRLESLGTPSGKLLLFHICVGLLGNLKIDD